MKKIVLILPTYNEKDNIESLIVAIEDAFKKISGYKLQILIVDDESPDRTDVIVTKLAKKYGNIILLSKKKEGLGAALTFGFNYALKKLNPDIFIQMDADWQHNPALLPQFIKAYEKGADFVVGSRYIKGGSIPKNWGLHRKIFSIIGNNIVRFGLGTLSPHDWTSGYRMMRTEVYKKIHEGLSQYSGYTFQIASLHRLKIAGFKTAEVPLQFVDRIHGRSKIPFINYITNVLWYVFNNSTLIKYLIIGVIGFSVQTIISKLLILVNIFPGLAVGIGSFFAIVCNFFGNNYWTFSHNKIVGIKKMLVKFMHFLATSVGAVIIQAVVVGIGVVILGNSAWFLLMVFAIIFLVIPYNYFIYNKFIWRKN